MYIWKIDSLVADLRNGTLSQADRFKYLLAFMIITAFFMELSYFISELPSVVALSESAIVVFITIVGTIWCYQTNKSGDNQEFVDRFICLTLPTLIRLLVIFLIIYSLYIFLGFVMFGNEFDKFTETQGGSDLKY
ncbi:MAG: hypothetical protein SV375_17415 [Thermodesulfobacteriota bacterium]|nr:hypothetical protein [Thermodesulfobacteriota bacterium]